MAKHFTLDITDTRFSFARKTDEITTEAALDGLYVVRTSLPAAALDDTATVRSYKSLSLVERAFRCIKTVDLQVRPVYHWLADRVRAHVFLCMLAYYLEWHTLQRRRQSPALPRRRHQTDPRPNHRWPPGPQLPDPPGRSRYAHPQHPRYR